MVLKMSKITHEEARKILIINTKIKGVSIKNQNILNDYIKQQEQFANKVKRYLELKSEVLTFRKTDNFEVKWDEFLELEQELKL
jgi:hypothetical protein